MGLEILCEEQYRKAKAHAVLTGGDELLKQFESQLEYLNNYANGEGCMYDKAEGKDTLCRLYADFAPFSFSFVMLCRENYAEEWKQWFHGGLIYQGPGQPADGSFPSLTVSIDTKRIGWFVHT